jgi:alpha-glucosidase
MPAVIAYATQRGIGMTVYVDRKQIRRQRDILFPLYEKWGVKAVKIGFIDVGSQADTEWFSETVRKAAMHHLLLDVHDQYRPTGYTRTYPNLLTVEGIRGNEHFPTAQHDATLPFTRYLAGSADYTIAYFTKRLRNTHAHQLAMTIISYSPLQSVFWYDQPSDYHGEPEMKWFEDVPTTWDDTRVVSGEIGKYAVEARRSGEDWFVGAVNSDAEKQLPLSLSFLKPGKAYSAEIYSDDPSVDTATHIAVHAQPVDSKTLLQMPLTASSVYFHQA